MEILVLGDGRFVYTVLNAVASIRSYGQLAAVGALVGLAVMLMRGIMSPQGPKIDLAPVLLSIVFYWVMFIPRVDRVVVTEMMPPPGGQAPRTYVVDNVPFGLAGAGYFISNVGLGITGLYDTVMGRPTDSDRVLTGGLGRNIQLLAHLQAMVGDKRFSAGAAGGEASEYDYFRANMIRYMTECVAPPINTGYVEPGFVKNSTVEEGVLGPKFASELRSVGYATRDGGGRQSIESITCKAANEKLTDAYRSPDLLKAFDRIAKAAGGASVDEITAAFGELSGKNVTNAQNLIAGHMVSSLLAEAQVRGALSPQAQQAIIMLEEANVRRATQWAAEENLFVRLLRPTIGFFEALFYALGPIMAFVIMLGPSGWGMVVKYMMLTIWVSAWFPMLTLTHLYSKMQMEDFFAQLGSVDQYTPSQLELIASQAMTTLGATSALVAATPALAMSLLYGGAVSMSYLAGRLQHGDVVDEEKMVPKGQGAGAVADIAAARAYDQGRGLTVPGGAKISFSEQEFAQAAQQSADQRMETASQQAMSSVFQAVRNGATFTTDASRFESHSDSISAANKLGEALRESEGQDQSVRQGADLLKTLSADQTSLVMKAAQYAQQHGVSFSAGLREVGLSLGYSESYMNTLMQTTQTSDSTAESDRLSNSKAIVDAVSYGISKDRSIATEMARGLSHEVGERIGSGWGTSLSKDDGEQVQSAMSELQSASRVYSETHGVGWMSGRSTEMSVSQLHQRLEANGALGVADNAVRLIDASPAISGDTRLIDRQMQLQAAIENSEAGMSPADAHRMAAVWTLMEQGGAVPGALRAEANDIVTSVLSGSSTFTTRDQTPFGASGQYQGVAGGAEAAGARARAAAGGIMGSGTSAGAISGMVGAGMGSVSASVDASGAALTGQANAHGLADGNYRSIQADYETGKRRFMDAAEDRRNDHVAMQEWAKVDAQSKAEADAAVERARESALPASRGAVERFFRGDGLREYAERVNDLATMADQLQRQGHVEQAEEVRAIARQVTAPAMVQKLQALYVEIAEAAPGGGHLVADNSTVLLRKDAMEALDRIGLTKDSDAYQALESDLLRRVREYEQERNPNLQATPKTIPMPR